MDEGRESSSYMARKRQPFARFLPDSACFLSYSKRLWRVKYMKKQLPVSMREPLPESTALYLRPWDSDGWPDGSLHAIRVTDKLCHQVPVSHLPVSDLVPPSIQKTFKCTSNWSRLKPTHMRDDMTRVWRHPRL